jgi:hypothetical protein
MPCIDAQPLMKMRRGLTVQPADTRNAANDKGIIIKDLFIYRNHDVFPYYWY